MQHADFLDELLFGSADIERRLAGLRIAKENNEVHRMAGAKGHANLGIILESADARTKTGARVDDEVRALPGIHDDPFRRFDPQHRVVDWAFERTAIEDDLEVKMQDQFRAEPRMFGKLVAAPPQSVPEEDGTVQRIDGVLHAGPGIDGLQDRMPRDVCAFPSAVLIVRRLNCLAAVSARSRKINPTLMAFSWLRASWVPMSILETSRFDWSRLILLTLHCS